MKLKFVFSLIYMLLVGIADTQNYCDQSLCGDKQHIACNNSGKFAARCQNSSMIQFTQAQKNQIVRMHNNKRNQVAGGNTKLQAACRMATMQWNNELAQLAALNVKQCQMRHDDCHNTNTFKQSGQNLAMITFPLQIHQTPEILPVAINAWYKEIQYTNMSHIKSYPQGYTGPVIGHFTAMVVDRNTHVGCAAATYNGMGSRKNLLITCNYASTNIIGVPIYTTCSVAASGCKTGKNSRFQNLCSISEKYV